MALQLKIEQYEGPLDLLLTLITKHKIDIFDIPIAEVCDSYTQYLDSMRELNMDIASEFIYMAAELMLIKSRMLLPREEDEEDPRTMLVDALLEHAKAKRVAEYLREQSVIYYDRFIKPPDELDLPYSREHNVSLLADAFMRVAERMANRPLVHDELVTKMTTERWYTVEEKILYVLRRLYGREMTFDVLFDSVTTRNELCALFMALLEMVKSGRVAVRRDGGDIYLSLVNKHFIVNEIPQEEE